MTFRKTLPVLALGAACAFGLPAAKAVAQAAGSSPATPSPASPTSGPRLPGGASALSETHGDWTVNCRIANASRFCSFSYQEFNKANGQRLLAVELTTGSGQEATGALAMPFGLALGKGITFRIDDGKSSDPLEFSTCQVVGCLVPVAFDTAMLEGLKAGIALKISGVAADTGQPVEFGVSLKGFSSALARTAQLSAE